MCIRDRFKVVDHRQNAADALFATIQNQFRLLLHGTFAVIVKLSGQAQIFAVSYTHLVV